MTEEPSTLPSITERTNAVLLGRYRRAMDLYHFSETEAQVFLAARTGSKSLEDIAAELGLDHTTVSLAVKGACRRMKVRNLTHAILALYGLTS